MPEFVQPKGLQSAMDLLMEKEDVKFLAGGTDIIILMRNKVVSCKTLMDVKKIPELSVFKCDGNNVEIGGAITCNQVIEADFLPSDYDVLKEAASTLANGLLRNRATVVGNICNASPGGDMLTACLVLGGSLVAVSPRGQREIPLKEFFTGVKKHVLAPDEIAVKLVFPKVTGRGAYLKKRRIRGHDLAQVGVSGFYSADGKLSLAYGAVGPTPVLVDDLGRFESSELVAKKDEIIDKALNSISPISDIRSSKEYRIAMAKLFTERLIDAFAGNTEVVR